MLKRSRQIILVALFAIFMFAIGKSIVEAAVTPCTFCCNPGCNGAQQAGSVPTASPTPTPTPTATPTPTPTGMPLTFAGSVVGQSAWTNSGPQNTTLNAYKSYAKILITSWYSTTGADWCTPAKAATTTITICGPYNDFGYTFTGCDSSGNNCSSTVWNNSDNVAQWHLDSTYFLYGCTPVNGPYCEAVMDWRITAYVDYYKALLVNGWGNDTYVAKAGTGMNAMFFDNGFFDGQVWWWNNSGGVTRAAWKTAMINALDTIRTYYDTQGDTIVMNGWTDISDWDLYNADVSYYRSVADKVQYIVFEQAAYGVYTGSPTSTTGILHYIDMAFDYNTNTNTMILWTTEYGADFWYNFTTGLLACTATKCGFWQQPAMTSTEITKTTTLNLGTPTAPYALSGCYYRTFTNGIVVVNLNTGSTCNYTLPAGNYTDWIAGGTVSGTRTIADDSGKIYIGPL